VQLLENRIFLIFFRINDHFCKSFSIKNLIKVGIIVLLIKMCFSSLYVCMSYWRSFQFHILLVKFFLFRWDLSRHFWDFPYQTLAFELIEKSNINLLQCALNLFILFKKASLTSIVSLLFLKEEVFEVLKKEKFI
jgi:hypothetical protein